MERINNKKGDFICDDNEPNFYVQVNLLILPYFGGH